jgi:transposase
MPVERWRGVSSNATANDALATFKAHLEQTGGDNAALLAAAEKLASERDEYRRLYLATLELCRKLEKGIIGQKRERVTDNESQLTLALLGLLTSASNAADTASESAEEHQTQVPPHTRAKPTGRKPLPEHLPRVDIEIVPVEVQQQGLDAFERIGEDVTETVERRPGSLVVVRVHRPKFVPKGRDRAQATTVAQAAPPELPIERGLAGPGLLADTIVRRWQDHLPLHRLESIYARDGLELARSTICGWHMELANLVRPLIDAIWNDALASPILCTDATGVLVQAKDQCRRGHFWVVVAPDRHVLFRYSPKHDAKAVDRLLGSYKGYLLADAHGVYDHLFKDGTVVEVSCWAHARRYFFKALLTDPERAKHGLALINELFRIERVLAADPPVKRLALRVRHSKQVVDKFFAWCDTEAGKVLDESPISTAIGYARNQRLGLQRFLGDGRLPLHNNRSELELRRQAIGRKNWLFVGTDDGGDTNATFVTLLASCQLHRIEPWTYLRDLLCVLPSWPKSRVLELSPLHWRHSSQQQDAQQRLLANRFRAVTLSA